MIRIRCLVNGSSKTRLFGFSYVFGVMQDSLFIPGGDYFKNIIVNAPPVIKRVYRKSPNLIGFGVIWQGYEANDPCCFNSLLMLALLNI